MNAEHLLSTCMCVLLLSLGSFSSLLSPISHYPFVLLLTFLRPPPSLSFSVLPPHPVVSQLRRRTQSIDLPPPLLLLPPCRPSFPLWVTAASKPRLRAALQNAGQEGMGQGRERREGGTEKMERGRLRKKAGLRPSLLAFSAPLALPPSSFASPFLSFSRKCSGEAGWRRKVESRVSVEGWQGGGRERGRGGAAGDFSNTGASITRSYKWCKAVIDLSNFAARSTVQ